MNLSSAAHIAANLVTVDSELRGRCELPDATSGGSLREALDAAQHTSSLIAAQDGIDAETSLLLVRSLKLQSSLDRFLATRRRAVVHALSHSLRRLGAPSDGRAFARLITVELVRTAGFGAAMFSRPDGDSLLPESISHSADVEQDVGELGRLPISTAERLCGTAADRIMLAERAIAGPAIAATLDSNVYIVAEITADDQCVGVIHVGQSAPLALDDDDLEIVSLYQRAISATLAREASARRVVGHQRAVRQLATALLTDSDEMTGDLEFVLDHEGNPPPDHALSSPPTSRNRELDDLLTPRETEVMRLIAAGESNAEIAATLFIGTETVKSHVKRILRKIGAVNRSEAISLYLDRPF